MTDLFVQVSGSELETRLRILWLKVLQKSVNNDKMPKVAKFISETAVGQEIASKCLTTIPK